MSYKVIDLPFYQDMYDKTTRTITIGILKNSGVLANGGDCLLYSDMAYLTDVKLLNRCVVMLRSHYTSVRKRFVPLIQTHNGIELLNKELDVYLIISFV